MREKAGHYPYDAGVALDAPLTKKSMEPMIEFTRQQCKVEDELIYYLYGTDTYPVEALALSDYNHLRCMLGLKPVSLSANEFFIHCDTWNYVEKIQKALEQKSKITLAGNVLEIAETAIHTEPICLIVYPVFFLLAVGACLLATAIPLRRISKINIVDSIEMI